MKNLLSPIRQPITRAITGCLKPTRVDDLDLLCGIAPPSISRESFSQIEITKQERYLRHPLFQHETAPKPRNSFLHAVKPLNGEPYCCRIDAWSTHLKSRLYKVSRVSEEFQPNGVSEPWPTWLCFNRLRIGVARCRQ